MRKVCSWCLMEQGFEGPPETDDSITHGICESCLNNIQFQSGIALKDFLDSFRLPIVAVDSEGLVCAGNDAALEIVQKDTSQVEGYRGGEVFECAYARLPEGCGNTVHCSGCTIRKTVMDTHKTGEMHLNVPAKLNQGSPDDTVQVGLLVSTEKVGRIVLLRIDEMKPDGQ